MRSTLARSASREVKHVEYTIPPCINLNGREDLDYAGTGLVRIVLGVELVEAGLAVMLLSMTESKWKWGKLRYVSRDVDGLTKKEYRRCSTAR